MKTNRTTNRRPALMAGLACAALGWMCWTAGSITNAQTPPAIPPSLSPDLQEVVALSEKGMSNDVIVSYIKNSGKPYKLSADDIIYLNGHGVSQAVIAALLQTAPAVGSATNAPAPAVPPPAPEPPPLEAGPAPSPSTVPPPAYAPAPAPAAPVGPATVPPLAPAPALAPTPVPVPAGLQDNFFTDAGLNPSLWLVQSGLLPALASMRDSAAVLPVLAFSPSGMQVTGPMRPRHFMGIQSVAAFVSPFRLNATVTGLEQRGTPFEVYLVSDDLRQWLSISGHLGGRGSPAGGIRVGGGVGPFRGRVAIPLGGSAPDYGVWLNYPGSGFSPASLGHRLFGDPLAGVPYTIQVAAGEAGAASVSLLDSAGAVLAARSVQIGPGPFHVVLAGRDGPTAANWQSIQLIPPTPVAVAPAVAPAVVPERPTLDYFQAQLSPYGYWTQVPGYGLCWQPVVPAGWRPYYDGGHWEYTDAGWYWRSEYPWGDIAFHYGRWAFTASGWVWVPGYEYAPAWVFWRHADAYGYVGWAPLPPGALFVDGGWLFRGARVGVDFDFGLGVGFFNFVACDHFWDHDFWRHPEWRVPRERLDLVWRHSAIENHYRLDHGRFVHEGLARERMAAITHHEIKEVARHEELRHAEQQHNAAARADHLRDFKQPGAKPNAMREAPARPAETRSARPEPGGASRGAADSRERDSKEKERKEK